MSEEQGTFWRAIEELRGELQKLLPGDAGDRLGKELADLQQVGSDPQRQDRAMMDALKLINQHPRVAERLRRLVGDALSRSEAAKRIDTLPGTSEPVPAGTRMVCPVDPSHYQRKLRQAGQRLYCPDHNVLLIPAGTATPKEGES